jgi:hypothetical protein
MVMPMTEDERGRQLAMKMPGLMFQTWQAIPSPSSAALFAGLAGVGLAMLLGKGERWWKWGLTAGGGAFLASAAVKGSFGAGLMSGGMMMAQACIRDPQEVSAMFQEVFSVPAPVGHGAWEAAW